MDDAGFKLIKRTGDTGWMAKVGHLLVELLPLVIKCLGVVGTLALILVSGGIFAHNIDYFHHLLPTWPSILKETAIGLIAGLIAVGILTVGKKIFSRG